jgi:SAM-dependent methyltransferase
MISQTGNGWKNMWDMRYSEPGLAYGSEPNEFFRQVIDSMKPGKILLPGEGEGRNAIYAASVGWEVTALDISEVARKKALEWAAREKLKLDYYVTPLEEYDGGTRDFDLIALIYLHMPASIRSIVHSSLIRYLTQGGTLMMEAFHKQQINQGTGGPRIPDLLYSEKEIADDFRQLNVALLEHLAEDIYEGKYHQGASEIIRFRGIR